MERIKHIVLAVEEVIADAEATIASKIKAENLIAQGYTEDEAKIIGAIGSEAINRMAKLRAEVEEIAAKQTA